MSTAISLHNKREWARRSSALAYRKDTQVFAAEAAMLRDIGAEFRDCAILDIGVGTGRSTHQLLDISADYVGIDYSAAMVAVAQAACPGVDIREVDARDLTMFRDAQFDLVWFSFNGIDYVSHEERLAILSEVRRVLKPSGAFCFSSHNRDYPVRRAHDLSHIMLSWNPLRLLKSAVLYVLGVFNSASRRRQEAQDDDYAILNDEGNRYRLLTYYISERKQIAQLEGAGFFLERSYGMKGDVDTTASGHADSFMIHYLARPKDVSTRSDAVVAMSR